MLPFDVSSLVVWCSAGTGGSARSPRENSHCGRKNHFVAHCTVGGVMLFPPQYTLSEEHFSDADVGLYDHQKVNAQRRPRQHPFAYLP